MFVRKKSFIRKQFPIINDKSVIICQKVNIFLMKFRHIMSKGQKYKFRKFQALSLSEKKLLKKVRQGGKFTRPPPFRSLMHDRVNKDLVERFGNAYEFFDGERSKFCLMLRKKCSTI